MKCSVSDARVGIVSWDYGEQARGGLGRAMAEMATCLCGAGLDSLARQIRTVSFCAPPSPAPQGTNNIMQRVSQMIRRIVDSRFLFIARLFGGLQQWIDTCRIQTVIFPTGPGGLFLLRKPQRCRLVVVSYHTYWQQSRMVPGQWWKRVFIPLERRTFALADQVLCYSSDTERVLLQQYGVHRTKLKLLPQLLDVAVWSSFLTPRTYHPTSLSDSELRGAGLTPKESGLCICVARLDRRKGVDVLLRAWPSVVGAWPTAHLVIVGDGRGRTQVRDVAARHSSMRWIPSLPQEELIRLVQRAEISICPSYLEGFGLACAEAMAARTAVVASNCDGLRSLVRHRETGWLVPPGDPVALADGIIALLSDAALRERLARQAQERLSRFFNQEEATQRFLREVVYSSRA